MKLGKTLRFGFIVFALTLTVASQAMADLYWESEQKNQGMPGQQDGIQLIKNYLKGNTFRFESPDTITIMDMEQMKMFSVDPKKKTFNEVDLKSIGRMPEMKGEEGKQMQEIMKKMMGSFEVVPTGETRKISGYKCTKYNVSFMGTKGEYWISNNVEGYEELMAYSKRASKIMGQNPMFKQINFASLMEDLKGFPIETMMKMANGTSTTTLKKIERKGLAGDLFKVPAGFKKTE
ncbi:MAG: DUF4412 domain-containing protein [Pseudomonadota bacterium]